jgi:shikimate 5-dehydrogenase
MLVEQARRQFGWWTGHVPEPRLFLEAAEARLAAVARDAAPEAT